MIGQYYFMMSEVSPVELVLCPFWVAQNRFIENAAPNSM